MMRQRLLFFGLPIALVVFAGCVSRPSSDLAALIGQDPPTVAACERFKMKHPDSPYLPFVHMKQEALAWREAMEADSVTSYADFLRNYPRSINVEQARVFQQYLALRPLLMQETIAGYSQFLQSAVDGPAANEAAVRLRERRFEDSCRRNDVAAYREFCFLYPNRLDPLTRQARERWEQAVYAEIVKHNEPAGFSEFLDSFPSGVFRAKALERLDLFPGPDPGLWSPDAPRAVWQVLAASSRLQRLGWITGLTQRIAAPEEPSASSTEKDRTLLLDLLNHRIDPGPVSQMPVSELPPQQSFERTMGQLAEVTRLEKLLTEIEQERRRFALTGGAVLERLEKEGTLIQAEANAAGENAERYDQFIERVRKYKADLAVHEQKLAAEASDIRASLDRQLRRLEDVWFVAVWDPDYPASDEKEGDHP